MFVGYVQVFSDKLATTLNSTALAAYPIAVVLVDVSLRARLWPIENGPTLVKFSPVTKGRYMETKPSVEDTNRSALQWFTVTDKVEAKKLKKLGHSAMQEMKMNIIHESTLDILNLLERCGSLGFEMGADGEESGYDSLL